VDDFNVGRLSADGRCGNGGRQQASEIAETKIDELDQYIKMEDQVISRAWRRPGSRRVVPACRQVRQKCSKPKHIPSCGYLYFDV
jgi:hypothetical protein